MKKIFLSLIVIFLFNSCNGDDPFFDPTYFGEGFKGITFTGEDDPTPFKSDPTDWCTFSKEDFNKLTDVQILSDTVPIIPLFYKFGPAYPNPVVISGTFNIPFTLAETTFVYLYIINNDYQIVKVLLNEFKNAGSYFVSVHSSEIGPAAVYRVVFETRSINCKGDIWIKGKTDLH